MTLRAPFPYFGGKSRVAPVVWRAFGDPGGYIEPFFGSGAVLLGRPGGASGVETINDRDRFVANFWRAIKGDPVAVAEAADWPVNECDLLARHRWLVSTGAERIAALEDDPEHFDAKVAGWWAWGACAWIGRGWCEKVHWRQLPHLGDGGKGLNGQLPHLGNGGMGVHATERREGVEAWFSALSRRLRNVRVACGDWKRVTGPSVQRAGGAPCAVLLDPPYATGHDLYGQDATGVAQEARAWAIENGGNAGLRIALCGYDGEDVPMPKGWYAYRWSSRGAYVGKGDGASERRHRETIWFSPHCLAVDLEHARQQGKPLIEGLFDE